MRSLSHAGRAGGGGREGEHHVIVPALVLETVMPGGIGDVGDHSSVQKLLADLGSGEWAQNKTSVVQSAVLRVLDSWTLSLAHGPHQTWIHDRSQAELES